MPLVLAGATSGQATLQATDAATVTLTLPASTGTLVTTGGAQTIEFADGSAAAPSITNSGDTNTGMFFPAADTIGFAEGGTEVMRIAGDGNNTFVNYSCNGLADAVQLYTGFSGTSSFLSIGTKNSGTLAERMRITSDGNVGIGTSSPPNRLTAWSGGTLPSAVANAQLLVGDTSGFANAGIALVANAVNDSSITFGSTASPTLGRIAYSNTNNAFTFSTNGANERMRIDSSGRVFASTTNTAPSPNNVYGVVLNSDGNGNYAAGVCQFSANGSSAILLNRGSDDGTTMAFRRTGTQVGAINVTGSSTSYVTSSDYRLKDNVAPMTGALDKVSALKPCTYTWKSTGGASQGFIAHELSEVVPECVTGEKDGMRTEQYEVSPAIEATYDEEGNELTPAVEAVMGEREVPSYQGVDTSFLVATLTCAIQEQQALITQLQADVAALKGAA